MTSRRLPGGSKGLATAVATGVATVAVVSVLTFLSTNAIPTDPARIALGRSATAEQLKLYREQQGLQKPLITRYALWLGHFATGDWGTSTLSRQSVRSVVVPRLVRTSILAVSGMLIAVVLALAIGVYSGQRTGSAQDVSISVAGLFLNSLPEFVIGLFGLLFLAVLFPVLPVESSGAAYATGLGAARAYALPVITLVLVYTPYLIRMVRANVRDVAREPFVQSAILRGLPPAKVSRRHIAPNAVLPVVSVMALTMAELIGGLVVVEEVFGFPGVGKLLVDSVLGADIPTVQAIALVICVVFVVLSLAADGVLLILDPRLRAR